jgi:cytochrome c oxidase assembly protein subunit 15
MGHLMGGLATLSLLLWLSWRTRPQPLPGSNEPFRRLRPAIVVTLLVLVVQLMLGGWTSANYSALACPDFPTCQGQIWPAANFTDGFVMWREVGVDYEGGVLDLQSRVAIHMAHRTGALVTLLVAGFLAIALIRQPASRTAGWVLGGMLLAQIALGIQNVVLHLPLVNAVAHNGMGALLLAAMLWLLNRASEQVE